ncbi:MAG TPA: NAD-binding protein [Stellaceae bacterium]|jgi:3-hydroxyisobutyrate dehydrogenase-like beta-hydroxyacid dehydrogenase
MHNSATFTLDLVMAECWTTAVKAGIDPATIVKVFTEAALGNQMNLKVRLPATYLQGDFVARFSLALARKDLGLAQDLAAETGRQYASTRSPRPRWTRRSSVAGPNATRRVFS